MLPDECLLALMAFSCHWTIAQQVCQLLGHGQVELLVRAQLTIFPQSSAIANARLFLPPAGRIEFTEERAACSREREREREGGGGGDRAC
jgi:hypothetical protein